MVKFNYKTGLKRELKLYDQFYRFIDGHFEMLCWVQLLKSVCNFSEAPTAVMLHDEACH